MSLIQMLSSLSKILIISFSSFFSMVSFAQFIPSTSPETEKACQRIYYNSTNKLILADTILSPPVEKEIAQYSIEDFNLSVYGNRFNKQDLFQKWASQSANNIVATKMRSESDLVKIFDNLAITRRQLARQQGEFDNKAERFGKKREQNAYTNFIVYTLHDPLKDSLLIELKRLAERELTSENPTPKIDLQEESQTWSVANEYKTLNGESIKASVLEKTLYVEGTVYMTIRHQSYLTYDFVLQDIFQRLMLLLNENSKVQTTASSEVSAFQNSALTTKEVVVHLKLDSELITMPTTKSLSNIRSTKIENSKNSSADDTFNNEANLVRKKKEFLRAMYGYYNAMPFERGSAAIGRVFFSAMYLKIFHRKIPTLPDGIDLRAMIMKEDDFVARMMINLD